jgi:hypothetical protein
VCSELTGLDWGKTVIAGILCNEIKQQHTLEWISRISADDEMDCRKTTKAEYLLKKEAGKGFLSQTIFCTLEPHMLFSSQMKPLTDQ